MESILTSIKKLLGMTEDYDVFDTDITIHINSAFMVLTQLGVGPSEGFTIFDKDEKWTDFISTNDKRFEAVKSYVYMKVKLIFDPPSSSSAMKAMEEAIKEYEWRLNVAAENSKES